MEMLIFAFVTFAATMIGKAIDSYTADKAQKAQEAQNQANLELTKDQIAYNKELNQNQFQWQADDMSKAGLNPMMAQAGSLSPLSGTGVNFNNSNHYAGLGSGLSDSINSIMKNMTDNSLNKQRLENEKASLANQTMASLVEFAQSGMSYDDLKTFAPGLKMSRESYNKLAKKYNRNTYGEAGGLISLLQDSGTVIPDTFAGLGNGLQGLGNFITSSDIFGNKIFDFLKKKGSSSSGLPLSPNVNFDGSFRSPIDDSWYGKLLDSEFGRFSGMRLAHSGLRAALNDKAVNDYDKSFNSSTDTDALFDFISKQKNAYEKSGKKMSLDVLYQNALRQFPNLTRSKWESYW